MTSQLTRNYWLDVFAGWVEARNMPGPQNDEALAVISELKAAEARAAQLQAERDTLRQEVIALRGNLEYVQADRDDVLKRLERLSASMSEALNSGDGAYRP